MSAVLRHLSILNYKVQTENTVRLVIAKQQSSTRKRIETFIANGFNTQYGAHIKEFMPTLVALENRGVKAALGIRSAYNPLFIEQYLPFPIQQHLAQLGMPTKRSQVAEIGNLFSASAHYTLPLLLSVCQALYRDGYQYLTFSATKQLANLLSSPNLKLHFLAFALQDKLTSKRSHWGTYYQSNPMVMALSLHDAVHAIQTHKTLSLQLDKFRVNKLLPSGFLGDLHALV